ncbi:MAG: Mrp/NBP35 family ATP-binding protein [Thermoleophilaceae bacterium]|jgi:ATP-binding protein involved in chromosome partitioning|nr:Mrp/NBP35 family ATP-binding protein [Thermoleophilaceae bacterium]
MPSEEQIRDALRKVIDPELRKDIVELGMVRSIEQPGDGRVHVRVSLTTAGCPIRSHFTTAVAENVGGLEGVTAVTVDFDVLSDSEKQTLQQRLGRQGGLPQGALARVKNVICVGSGKGGVGKSTVTSNLAAALQMQGKTAAAMDADVWGYSIPRMLGVHGRPKITADRKIVPLVGAGGVQAISIEFFLDREDQAITWRGPMLHKAIRQFLEDVEWGELDYLLIDLPPGTGDVSMTLAQLLPQSQFVIVTTPQPAAQKVAKRAADTAQRYDLQIAGVVENMSGFTTPAGERLTIFGEGGGQELADELDVPLLGKVPLDEALRIGADEGRPLVLEDPDAPSAQALLHTARGLIAATPQQIAVLQEPSGPPMEGVPEVTGTALPMAH